MNNDKVKIVVNDNANPNELHQDNKSKNDKISEKISQNSTYENEARLIFNSYDDKNPSFNLLNEYITKNQSFSKFEKEMNQFLTVNKNILNQNK